MLDVLSLVGVSAGRVPPLLERVDWRVRKGELWAIVGPNGAGKSSLLRVLRGRLPVERGTLRYGSDDAGRALAADPAGQVLQVSFAAQSTLLHGAAGYVQSRWHGGQDEAAARAREVLAAEGDLPELPEVVRALGLEALLDRRVTELSNGERRKLLIARAAARGPAVLALDNPFNGLDRTSRETLSDALRQLHAAGVTVLLVTSRADEIPDGVTHVLLLDRGRAVLSGPRAVVEDDDRFTEVMGRRPRRTERVAGPTPPPHRATHGSNGGGTPVVELRGVDVRYGRTRVLDGIDWTVRRGERWVVLGANGAGKSALLSLVLTDNPQAYANDVRLFGTRRGSGESIWEIRGRIGCVSPEMHLYHREPEHRVIDVVRSGFGRSLGPLGRSPATDRSAAEECLDALGLAHCRTRRFGTLSEGERQMVLVARALAGRPELLVLDEPSQGLDGRRRALVLDRLERTLGTSDTTLILVTHDLDDVPAGMTHGLLLRRGRSALQAPADRVLAAYVEEGERALGRSTHGTAAPCRADGPPAW